MALPRRVHTPAKHLRLAHVDLPPGVPALRPDRPTTAHHPGRPRRVLPCADPALRSARLRPALRCALRLVLHHTLPPPGLRPPLTKQIPGRPVAREPGDGLERYARSHLLSSGPRHTLDHGHRGGVPRARAYPHSHLLCDPRHASPARTHPGTLDKVAAPEGRRTSGDDRGAEGPTRGCPRGPREARAALPGRTSPIGRPRAHARVLRG